MRVHYVKAAAKDNAVVKKGEPYYWWKFRRGGMHLSKTRPRQSQLTTSDKLSRVYAAQELVEDFGIPNPDEYDTPSDLADVVDELASVWTTAAEELCEVSQEYRDSADNIRAHFSESSTADECEEKADSLDGDADEAESMVSTIEGAANSIRSIDFDEPEDKAEAEATPEAEAKAEEASEAAAIWRTEAQGYLDEIDGELTISI